MKFVKRSSITYGIDRVMLVRKPKLELQLEIVVFEKQKTQKFLLRVERLHRRNDVTEIFAEIIIFALMRGSVVSEHLRLV